MEEINELTREINSLISMFKLLLIAIGIWMVLVTIAIFRPDKHEDEDSSSSNPNCLICGKPAPCFLHGDPGPLKTKEKDDV